MGQIKHNSHQRSISTLAIAILLLATLPLFAQTPATPVPSQFATAHTAFLASGSAPGAGGRERLIAQMVYTSAYNSLSTAGRYHLVSMPADAELSMVISAESRIFDVSSGSSSDSIFLRLEIYDIKTHTLLWALDESVNGAFREKTFQKNVDQSVAALMDDLNALANGTIPGATTSPKPEPSKTNPTSSKPEPTKTRLSDEK